MVMLRIQPRDPMVVRDGRPFGLGDRMYSLNWPYPPTLAGMVRTLIGKLQSQVDNPFANKEFLQKLKAIEVGGPLPIKNDRVFFSAPGDALLYNTRQGKRYVPLRPQQLQTGEGTDLSGQWPVDVAIATERGKPLPAPPFWSADMMEDWLCQDIEEGFSHSDQGEDVLVELPQDVRVHVSIDPRTYRAKDGELFCTKGVTFLEGNRAVSQWSEVCEIAMGARIRTGLDMGPLSQAKPLLHPFGGKGRLAHITSESTPLKGWEIPDKLKSSLGKAMGVRMILATPAAFAKGWLPAWLDSDSLAGAPPGVSSLKVKLKS